MKKNIIREVDSEDGYVRLRIEQGLLGNVTQGWLLSKMKASPIVAKARATCTLPR
jgi:hypothetical protein